MKLSIASIALLTLINSQFVFAANSSKIKSVSQQSMSGFTNSENDPNLKQAVARNETTGGLVKSGYYCATCGKWITNPPMMANTNPEASLANYNEQLKKTGRN